MNHARKNRTAVSAANLESNPCHASVEQEKTARPDPRFDITVTSYRKRRHDPDGVSVKAVLDGIIRAGLLVDDSTEVIRQITFRSEINKEEKTVIEISGATDDDTP